jgi:hypothetical protein
MLPRDFPKGVNPHWLRPPHREPVAAGPEIRALTAIQFSFGSRFMQEGDDVRPECLIATVRLDR